MKVALLRHLLRETDMPYVLVFTRTKHSARRMTRIIADDGFRVAELHGNRTQGQRVRAMEGFRAGFVAIVGRSATDLIKSGGYKIGAGEIENALLEHAGVAEAAVIGVPDDDLGERIVAHVVPAGEAPTERELIDHVATLLAPHKRPRQVRFTDALPRNDMGKVVKSRLPRE